jgi:PTH1 family peptidyl-tRNA hydrolase
MSISLVAGLGNPGRDYADSRHNTGWVVLDAFAQKHGLAWRKSSRFEAETADVHERQRSRARRPHAVSQARARAVIAVVYDDLTIDLGLVKVSVTGSAGGHNGVASLLEHLGDGFVRYRLGIGPKEPPQMDLKDFVLGKFTPEQRILIDQISPLSRRPLDLLLDRGRPGHEPAQPRDPNMNATKRNYRATFILDNRGKEDTIDQIIEGVKKEIAAVQGEVTAVENSARRTSSA